MQLEMMMIEETMIEETGIALTEEGVICLLIREAMIEEGDPRVHTIEIGVAQTMGMEQNQIPGLNKEEALTMTGVKAQPMRDTTG